MQDLHIHTKYSDGEYDEFEIIEKIIDSKIVEFAICDHDTIEGSQRVCEVINSKNLNLKFHTGVELTCRAKDYLGGINMHLLVRDFEYSNKALLNLIKEVSLLRKQKINIMVDYVYKEYGIRIEEDKIKEVIKSTNSVGKPHIYKLLCEYGDFSMNEFYKKMNKLDTSHLKLDSLKVLKLLNNEKGYVSLAHPIEIMKEYNFSYSDIDKLVSYLVSFGLKGIEVYHSKHTIEDSKEFSKIAKKYNLIETCGSDFHGENVKPDVKLGMTNKI